MLNFRCWGDLSQSESRCAIRAFLELIADRLLIDRATTNFFKDRSLEVSPAPVDLQKVALQRAEAKESGDRFTVRDLFSKQEWAAIESTKRLGKLFTLRVESSSTTIAFSHLKGTQRVYKRI